VPDRNPPDPQRAQPRSLPPLQPASRALSIKRTLAGFGDARPRAGFVNARIIIHSRWIAVAGQLVTVLVTHFCFGYTLPLLPLATIMVATVVLNVLSTLRQGDTQLMGERTALNHMLYDVIQLCMILFLTGGLMNPFSLLVLAPLTVSAALLPKQSVIIVSVTAIVGVTAIALHSLPLPLGEQAIFLPEIYRFGLWFGMILACGFVSGLTFLVAQESRVMSRALRETQNALGREQKASALGALAASAAHELGSPLGTIAVVVKELLRDHADEDGPLKDDLALLQSEVERCRAILTDLSKGREVEAADPFRYMALGPLIAAIAAPHEREDISFEVIRVSGPKSDMPVGERSPELIHGLGNIIQNAVQFAARRVRAEMEWNQEWVRVRIRDDGPGFPESALARLGEPFRSTRAGQDGHMGLGVFIARTLLAATGADVRFSNATSGGAVVDIRWVRSHFESQSDVTGASAGVKG